MLNEGTSEHSSRGASATALDMVHNGKMTKVERYKWTKVDEPGELKMLPKEILEVDSSYQRPINEAKVKEIASSFSFVAFGAAVVADRGDGRYFIIDAQHRVAAAMRRSDVKTLPCIVFHMDSLTDEARAFLGLNTMRKPLTGLEKHTAAVKAGDDASVKADSLARSIGRVLVESASDASRSIGCVRLLTRLAAEDYDRTRRVLSVLDQLAGNRPIKEVMLDGLFWVDMKMPPGETIADRRWRDRIIAVGYESMELEAKRMAQALVKGGRATWGRGILRAINKGLRHKLVLPGVEEL